MNDNKIPIDKIMSESSSYQKEQRAGGSCGEEGTTSAGTSFTRLSERLHERVTNEYVLNVAFYSFVGFLLLEAVFAIIAGSQSMLEDAEAMSVDALTYLFNLWAERVKHRPYTPEELRLTPEVRDYRREMQRLHVELVPPFISVATLVVVTVLAVRDAIDDIFYGDEDETEDDVDVFIMLMFSGANLLLDIVNVTCFARAHQAFGIPNITTHDPEGIRRSNDVGETHPLLEDGSDVDNIIAPDPIDDDSFYNLNMCSAWTVSITSRQFLCQTASTKSHDTSSHGKPSFDLCFHFILAKACLRRHDEIDISSTSCFSCLYLQ